MLNKNIAAALMLALALPAPAHSQFDIVGSMRRGQQDQICATRPDLCAPQQRQVPPWVVTRVGKDLYRIDAAPRGSETYIGVVMRTIGCVSIYEAEYAYFTDGGRTLVLANSRMSCPLR